MSVHIYGFWCLGHGGNCAKETSSTACKNDQQAKEQECRQIKPTGSTKGTSNKQICEVLDSFQHASVHGAAQAQPTPRRQNYPIPQQHGPRIFVISANVLLEICVLAVKRPSSKHLGRLAILGVSSGEFVGTLAIHIIQRRFLSVPHSAFPTS